jgi:hypothetical protein
MLSWRSLAVLWTMLAGLGRSILVDGSASRPPRPLYALPPGLRALGTRGARRISRLYTPNGKRECARRRRQIELGQLRVSA